MLVAVVYGVLCCDECCLCDMAGGMWSMIIAATHLEPALYTDASTGNPSAVAATASVVCSCCGLCWFYSQGCGVSDK